LILTYDNAWSALLIGMPIAYSLALRRVAGAWSIGHSAGTVMLKISTASASGDADDPVFSCWQRDHGGRRHGAPAVAFADVLVDFTRVRGGLSSSTCLATTS